MLLSLIPMKRRQRTIQLMLSGWRKWQPNEQLLRIFRIDAKKESDSNLSVLWSGCGFDFPFLGYLIIRKILLWTSYILLACGAIAIGIIRIHLDNWLLVVISIQIVVVIFFQSDPYWLRAYRQLRAVAITREIYAISGQLLYFAESSLHIHSKLRKCLPYSRLLRRDLEILLADWYHNPATALQALKQRIGTEEGISFIDTIDALRQHNHEHFYELLRTRLQDYKEKLELAKEGRKETTSYLLFVISGIPILYTFQVFIHPWVQEVNKLLSVMQ